MIITHAHLGGVTLYNTDAQSFVMDDFGNLVHLVGDVLWQFAGYVVTGCKDAYHN